MLLPVTPAPGVARNNTESGARGRWWDASLVRWYGADLGPVLGWRPRSDAPVTGAARSIIAWRDNSRARHIGVGTHAGLFVQAASGVVSDITPAGYTPGDINGGARSGYGEGPYGTGAFGVARPDTGDQSEATRWDLDTFGERLVGCANSDGTICAWNLDTESAAAPVSGAPTGCSGCAVTEQRAVMAFGAGGDARNVAWSDLENLEEWTPSAENQAGDFNLTTAGGIVRGLRLGSQMLILTTVDAHVAVYRGPPFVYGFSRVGQGCGAISAGCAVAAGQMAFWWGRSGFWRYDGGAVTVLPCDVQDFISRDLNRGQRSKISAYHNSQYGEVTWLYPSSAALENDRYVTFSYRFGWWTIGAMARGCGVEEGAFAHPLLVDLALEGGEVIGRIYEHERGHDYDGAVPFAETGPLGFEGWPGAFLTGERVMRVNGLIGDEATAGQVRVGFLTRPYPNAGESEVAAASLDGRGEADLRFTGRQVRMRVEGAAPADWRFGTARLRVEAGGGR